MPIYDKNGKLIIPDPAHFKPTGSPGNVLVLDKKVLVKQLYCPSGHPLISESNPRFDGKPAIHVVCEGDTIRQHVYLSPFQDDRRKEFNQEYRKGEILRVYCPECDKEFPKYAPHNCRKGAMYLAFFLNDDGDYGNIVGVCNVWGCPASFLHMAGEIYSEVRATYPVNR